MKRARWKKAKRGREGRKISEVEAGEANVRFPRQENDSLGIGLGHCSHALTRDETTLAA